MFVKFFFMYCFTTQDGKRIISEHVCPDPASHVSWFGQPITQCTQKVGPLSGVIPLGHIFLSFYGG